MRLTPSFPHRTHHVSHFHCGKLEDSLLVRQVDFFFFFLLFRASLAAYGSSQARGRIGAVASGLHHSHSNTGSKPCLQPTPQLTVTPDP